MILDDEQRPQTFEDWNQLFLLRQGTFTREQVEFERGEAWRCATASREAELAALKEDRNKLMGQVQEIVEQERLAVAAALREAASRLSAFFKGFAELEPFIAQQYQVSFDKLIAEIALIPPADQKALDAHDAEVRARAVLAESEWWANDATSETIAGIERLAANRAKVKP